jgi:8-oxo-dGTP pyrophosphatase MutT (NUDIX family)
MNNKKIISSGGFIFFLDKVENKVSVILVENFKNEFWFPKGKIEKYEDSRAAAFREIKEEVGFNSEMINYLGFCRLDNYQYEEDGNSFSKDVYINIFEAKEKFEPKPEDWENMKSLAWVDYDEAVNKISFNKQDLIDSFEYFKKIKNI